MQAERDADPGHVPLLGSMGGTFRHLGVLRLTKNWSIQTKREGFWKATGAGKGGGSYLRDSQEVPGQGGDHCSQGTEESVSGTYIAF